MGTTIEPAPFVLCQIIIMLLNETTGRSKLPQYTADSTAMKMSPEFAFLVSAEAQGQVARPVSYSIVLQEQHRYGTTLLMTASAAAW